MQSPLVGRLWGLGHRKFGEVLQPEAANHRLMPIAATRVKLYAPGPCPQCTESSHRTVVCRFSCRAINTWRSDRSLVLHYLTKPPGAPSSRLTIDKTLPNVKNSLALYYQQMQAYQPSALGSPHQASYSLDGNTLL